jgi:hypothetical protein
VFEQVDERLIEIDDQNADSRPLASVAVPYDSLDLDGVTLSREQVVRLLAVRRECGAEHVLRSHSRTD